MNISEDKIFDRNIFRERIEGIRRFKNEEIKRPGTSWAEDRWKDGGTTVRTGMWKLREDDEELFYEDHSWPRLNEEQELII